MSIPPREKTPTQDTLFFEWTPLLEFWRATTTNDRDYGQGPESVKKREPMKANCMRVLRGEECARLTKIIEDNPGIDHNLSHPEIGQLKNMLMDIAISMHIPKILINQYVYGEPNEEIIAPELEELWTKRKANFDEELQRVAERMMLAKNSKGKESKSEESSMSGSMPGAF